jgi:hypothetical protein
MHFKISEHDVMFSLCFCGGEEKGSISWVSGTLSYYSATVGHTDCSAIEFLLGWNENWVAKDERVGCLLYYRICLAFHLCIFSIIYTLSSLYAHGYVGCLSCLLQCHILFLVSIWTWLWTQPVLHCLHIDSCLLLFPCTQRYRPIVCFLPFTNFVDAFITWFNQKLLLDKLYWVCLRFWAVLYLQFYMILWVGSIV